jgi:hypothetical protein
VEKKRGTRRRKGGTRRRKGGTRRRKGGHKGFFRGSMDFEPIKGEEKGDIQVSSGAPWTSSQ